ncbi:hypothetical protein B0I35DRAFT_416348 [Stachybotrys elegans]|uniref:Transglutaminase-like domain-containing protein n=1 Tax=Stachybotrys elegans TaxID=80388 RepID=A0A8K0T187_9HYPO|nr:hypothetical protein B0I35DRAFT_416348 [Stachybotrys elegans]
MADTDEPQFNSLAERIAALKKQQSIDRSNNASPEPARKRPPPPPPPGRPAAESRALTAPARTNGSSPQTTPVIPARPAKPSGPPPLPRRDTQNSQAESQASGRPTPPPLPSRTPSSQSIPAIVPRQNSLSVNPVDARRNSTSSEISLRSTVSSSSLGHTLSSTTSHDSARPRNKLPPSFDQATLPPLPPTKRELEARAAEAAKKETTRPVNNLVSASSAPAIRPVHAPITTPPAAAPARPTLPPRLPSRPQKSTPTPSATHGAPPQQPPRQLPPRVPEVKQEPPRRLPPPAVPRPQEPQAEDAPPPIPLASRPSFAQIEAASARAAAQPQSGVGCLICRDWSGPDGVASQFPRESLPRHDPVGHLARGLCDPFPSYTDKARAIFTWFHHNIFYDTVAFFGNNIRHMSVEETIFSGKAVCQGYAETYKAIANRAGLECEVVVGHGKGYGHSPLKKGERPPPPKPDGHAWNAVRIDGGEWKLLDACWGAGSLDSSTNQYKQVFKPGEFTKPNDKFGMKHFPRESRLQFRNDGRVISWEEYFIGRVNGETPTVFTSAHDEGIDEFSVEPKEKDIPVYSGEVVRFQFSKICEHWTSEKHGLGKPPLLLLSINGLDGRKSEMIPMETNGYWHWLDVNARDLGAPGQHVQVSYLTTIDGRDGRGVSAKEFTSKRGKVGMAWAGIMKWELV